LSRIRYVSNAAVILLAVLAGCRSHPQSWPSDPPDLAGQVLEVRAAGGTVGTLTTDARGYGNAIDGRRLRIRVLSARSQEYAPEAYVMVDGVTQVARSGDAPGSGDHPDLEGSYVRVWLRSKGFNSSFSEVSGAARMIAIDSVATSVQR
jgi:hypothetical protein